VETTAVILAETSERKKTKTRSEVSNDQADKRQAQVTLIDFGYLPSGRHR
jgi:hypothetical protein